ncbi:MAG: TRAP transporter substrate-binding protein [Burkholderiales bacterium]|nr:TRAP transporter substrate-binding protein [Burkholderiales bacterium]MCC7113758.1 TRAP transporter substrate-binding protein [Burkholderiales bacterium]
MKRTATLVAVGCLGATMGATALAQEVTLKVHHWGSPKSPQHASMLVPWCEKVAKESGNRIKCDVFPSMQLGGSPPQLYDQARDGVVDVIFTIPAYTAGRFPLIEVFELPFMASTAEATSRAAWEYAATYAKDEFKETKLLALNVNGPCNVYTTKQPIRTQADFKGLKVRAPNRQTSSMLAMLGATPVGMPLPGIPEGLSKGVIDGAVVPYEIAPSIKLDELTKFVAETDRGQPAMCATVFATAMNLAKYNAMPADLKAVIDRNSGLELSGWMGRLQGGADVPAKQKIAEGGVKVNVIPADELNRWRQATASLEDQWASSISGKGQDGKALIRSARELVRKHTP